MSTCEYEVLTYYCGQRSILLDPEEEGIVLHRNGGYYLQVDMTQHTRKGDYSRNYAIKIITNTCL